MGCAWRCSSYCWIHGRNNMTNATVNLSSATNKTVSRSLSVFERYRGEEFTEVFLPETLYIYRYLIPVVYLLGFPGNILSFIVWIRRPMRHSSGYYLIFLALTDLLYLILHLVYYLQLAWFTVTQTVDTVLIYHVHCPLLIFPQYLSPLLVLGFTVERYISVRHPLHRKIYCTTKRAKIVVAGLATFAATLGGVQAYYFISDPEHARRAGSAAFSVWSWVTESFTLVLVPIVIFLFNICVMKTVCLRSKERQLDRHGTKAHSITSTVLLLSVSFSLIVTTVPVAVEYILSFNYAGLGPPKLTDEEIKQNEEWKKYFSFRRFESIAYFVSMTHHTCKFFIYCITGKMFRKELGEVVRYITRMKRTST